MRQTLRRGATGEDVRQMQHFLNRSIPRLRLPTLKEDGIFGPKTEEALRAFQKIKGLLVDGIYGEQSQATLACFHVVDGEEFYKVTTRTVWLKSYIDPNKSPG